MSWDDGFLGARAGRPRKACHSPGHLPHLDQPGMAPWLSFGLADAVPAHRVAACSIALKLSRGQRDRMRAGRPRSPAVPSRRCGGAVGGGARRATSQKADVHRRGPPFGNWMSIEVRCLLFEAAESIVEAWLQGLKGIVSRRVWSDRPGVRGLNGVGRRSRWAGASDLWMSSLGTSSG